LLKFPKYGAGNFDRSQPLPPKPAEKPDATGTLAESSRSGGHTIPSVLLGCRQIYANTLEVVQMGANQLAAYDFSTILSR
jgi:hypothetical protein